MGHIERKQREKERVRQDILDAALKIAVASGWQALTIRKIADAIEYTPPIVYEHFENKEDLIKELVVSGFRTLHERFFKAVEKESDPSIKLQQVSLIHWDFAFENRELFQLMFSLERPQPSEEGLRGMEMIKGIFMEITQKNEQEVIPMIFNWICLMLGTITTVMRFENTPSPHRFEHTPRELFQSFINRFITSI